jgi:hypothetical protein
MPRTIRLFIVGMAVLLSTCGGDKISGECTICPTNKAINLAACPEQGLQAGCDSAVIKEVTDTRCNTLAAPITHPICVYTECDRKLDCSAVTTFSCRP